MTSLPFARALRRAHLQDLRIAAVTPDLMKLGRRGLKRFLSTRNTAATRVRTVNGQEQVLHPTKGWRPISVKNSAASILVGSMKTGRMPWQCPPTIARAAMQKALASA